MSQETVTSLCYFSGRDQEKTGMSQLPMQSFFLFFEHVNILLLNAIYLSNQLYFHQIHSVIAEGLPVIVHQCIAVSCLPNFSKIHVLLKLILLPNHVVNTCEPQCLQLHESQNLGAVGGLRDG